MSKLGSLPFLRFTSIVYQISHAIFNFSIQIAEIIGGTLAGSLAIITDAAHLLSDCISFIVSIIAIYLSRKRPDNRMSFGYKRAGMNFAQNNNNQTINIKLWGSKIDWYQLCNAIIMYYSRGAGRHSLHIWYMDIDIGPVIFGHESFTEHGLWNRGRCNDDRIGPRRVHQYCVSFRSNCNFSNHPKYTLYNIILKLV